MARSGEGWSRQALLSDKNVQSWFDGRRLTSDVSAQSDLRKLALLTHRIGTDPAGVVERAKKHPEELARRLIQYATRLKGQGKLESYIAKTFSGLKSWLRFRRVTFDQYPRLRAIQGLSLRGETVPTQDQLGHILSALTMRGRAVALLMAHSGLRPGVLAHEGGTGLTLGDLPELDLNGEELAFEKVPFLVRVPATLSKTSREYVTFGTNEEAAALVAYLTHRMNGGEKFSARSPVIAVVPHQSENRLRGTARGSSFVTTETITYELRTGIKKVLPPGTRWRPYVLRAYCSTRLLSAENAGKITRDVREALLGHDLGVSGLYNLSKKLHPDMIEEMREAYRRAEPFLSTTKTQAVVSEIDLKKAILGVFLPEDEVAELDVAKLSAHDVRTLVGDKLRGAQATMTPPVAWSLAPQAPHTPPNGNGGSNGTVGSLEAVVPLEEVKSRLAEGWSWVAPFGSNDAILRRHP